MEFIPAAAMLALVAKVVDFLRYATNRDSNGVTTQAIAWAGGVVVAFLVAQTDWASAIRIGDKPLSSLGIWSLVFAGLTFGSGASLVKDTLKSVRRENTPKIPTLLPPGPRRARRTKEGRP